MMADAWDQFPDAQGAQAKDQWADFPDFRADPHAGMEHKPRPFSPEAGSFNFSAALKDALIRDPKTALYQISKSMFPNDPKAIERFGIYQGRPVYKDDNGSVRYVSSDLSNFLGGMVGNLPETALGTIGSMSASPVIGGTLGVMGARGLKDAAAGLLYDEPQTIKGNLLDVGKQGAIQLGTGLAAKGLVAASNAGRPLDITPSDLAAAQAKRDAIKHTTGVNTDLALASGDRRLLQLRNALAQMPATADAVQSADDLAGVQFDAATQKVLDSIAKSAPASTQGSAGINAAQGVIDDAIAARDAAVKPYYDSAAKVRLPVDIVDELNTDPLVARAAKRVASDPVFQRKLAGSPSDTIGFWQQVKRNLDAGYQSAAGRGNRTVASEYADAASQLTAKLKAASPEYAAANDFFATQTRQTVEPLQEGIVGVLARIKDDKAATAAAKLFSEENVGAETIYRARQMIAAKDPEAWDGLVRQFIQRELTKAQTVTQGGQEVNAAGKLYQALWGNAERQARMNAALGTSKADALKNLMETAQTLARAPVRGSDTAFNQEIARGIQGKSAWWVRLFTSPRETLRNAAFDRAAGRNSDLLWQALSDPAKVNQLRMAVRISEPVKRAAYISSVLGATAGGETLSRPKQPEVQWAAEMQ